MPKFTLLFLSLILFALAIGACSSTAAGDPADAVESYLQALAARDVNQMIGRSCAEWESQARLEYDSFAAVTLNLNNVACQKTGDADAAALVACSGSIVANYGAEDLEIDVADRTYRVVQENGEWRMCGYQGQ